MNAFDVLLERGFIARNEDGSPKQVSDLKIRELLGQQTITCYIGFDPTANSLHIGNLLQIMCLANMQRAGHRPIVVVGGGTGLIGDPSGKTKMRQILTREHIAENMEGQKKQFRKFLDFGPGKAVMVDNADWLVPLNYIEFLRDIGPHFSINRMLTADSVKLRLQQEQGLSFIEFNYMLLQAYDFLKLFQTHGCLLQMGGDDQWGNICAGIELIRRVEQKEAYGITFPLITTASGAKMGKTEKGAMWLDEKLLSPYEYYQFWRNCDDRDVEKFLGLFTFLPIEEVKRLGQLKDSRINEAKEVLAFETTRLNHGEAAAREAQETARKLFQEEGAGDSVTTIEITGAELSQGISIIDLLHKSGLAPSKGEARRLIQKGGAYLNRDRVDSIDLKVDSSHVQNGNILLRSGKKNYAKVVVK